MARGVARSERSAETTRGLRGQERGQRQTFKKFDAAAKLTEERQRQRKGTGQRGFAVQSRQAGLGAKAGAVTGSAGARQQGAACFFVFCFL